MSDEQTHQIAEIRAMQPRFTVCADGSWIAHSLVKGEPPKTKKRVANGVCPCCHRSFVNVARRMKGQHPDFAQDPNATKEQKP